MGKLFKRLFQNLDTISDLRKPNRILLDNPNLLMATLLLRLVARAKGTTR